MPATIFASLYHQSGVFSIRIIETSVEERNVQTARTFIVLFMAFSAACAVYRRDLAGQATKKIPKFRIETTQITMIATPLASN
jgi:hypothetical protein